MGGARPVQSTGGISGGSSFQSSQVVNGQVSYTTTWKLLAGAQAGDNYILNCPAAGLTVTTTCQNGEWTMPEEIKIACGSSGSGSASGSGSDSSMGGMDHGGMADHGSTGSGSDSSMGGMDHGGMADHGSSGSGSDSAMGGMDHGSMGDHGS